MYKAIYKFCMMAWTVLMILNLFNNNILSLKLILFLSYFILMIQFYKNITEKV
jgi:hypothetical protein